MSLFIIKLSEFTKFPSARYKVDGSGSGEQFRDEHLLPALKLHYQIIIDLNNVAGYPSSWIEEAFGGLVRIHNFKASDLRSRLGLDIDDRLQEEEIWLHIESADNNASE